MINDWVLSKGKTSLAIIGNLPLSARHNQINKEFFKTIKTQSMIAFLSKDRTSLAIKGNLPRSARHNQDTIETIQSMIAFLSIDKTSLAIKGNLPLSTRHN